MRFNHWPMPDLPVSFRKTKLWGLQDGCRGEGREGEREGLECSSRYRGHVDFRGCLCPAARKIRKIDAKKPKTQSLTDACQWNQQMLCVLPISAEGFGTLCSRTGKKKSEGCSSQSSGKTFQCTNIITTPVRSERAWTQQLEMVKMERAQ